MFPLNLFKMANFRLGLFYIFLLGIYVPATLQVSFTGGVLHYENYRNAELSVYLIPGVIAGAVFCYYWFYQAYHDQLLMLIGFSSIILYEIIMYHSFGTTFEMKGFWLPSLIKGFGLAVLYIAIGIYITRTHTIKDVLTVVGVAFMFRSFLGTAVFTAVYNYFIYAQRIRHLNYLGGLTDAAAAVSGPGSADVYNMMQNTGRYVRGQRDDGIYHHYRGGHLGSFTGKSHTRRGEALCLGRWHSKSISRIFRLTLGKAGL